jgi:hypothetical protein
MMYYHILDEVIPQTKHPLKRQLQHEPYFNKIHINIFENVFVLEGSRPSLYPRVSPLSIFLLQYL